MKRMAIPVSALLLLLATGPTALGRADDTYTVHCDDGNTYETVDAHAIESGGKDGAIVHFNDTPLGLFCWPEKN